MTALLGSRICVNCHKKLSSIPDDESEDDTDQDPNAFEMTVIDTVSLDSTLESEIGSLPMKIRKLCTDKDTTYLEIKPSGVITL